jgi:hypothetical protein
VFAGSKMKKRNCYLGEPAKKHTRQFDRNFFEFSIFDLKHSDVKNRLGLSKVEPDRIVFGTGPGIEVLLEIVKKGCVSAYREFLCPNCRRRCTRLFFFLRRVPQLISCRLCAGLVYKTSKSGCPRKRLAWKRLKIKRDMKLTEEGRKKKRLIRKKLSDLEDVETREVNALLKCKKYTTFQDLKSIPEKSASLRRGRAKT